MLISTGAKQSTNYRIMLEQDLIIMQLLLLNQMWEHITEMMMLLRVC
jgi:hypothetical protein